MTQQELQDTLEKLVDSEDIHSVLKALSDVCHAKADHLRSNWQDETSAAEWELYADKINQVRL